MYDANMLDNKTEIHTNLPLLPSRFLQTVCVCANTVFVEQYAGVPEPNTHVVLSHRGIFTKRESVPSAMGPQWQL